MVAQRDFPKIYKLFLKDAKDAVLTCFKNCFRRLCSLFCCGKHKKKKKGDVSTFEMSQTNAAFSAFGEK